jgi:hypothetical protein
MQKALVVSGLLLLLFPIITRSTAAATTAAASIATSQLLRLSSVSEVEVAGREGGVGMKGEDMLPRLCLLPLAPLLATAAAG